MLGQGTVLLALGAGAGLLAGAITTIPDKFQFAIIVGIVVISISLMMLRTQAYQTGLLLGFVFSLAANVSTTFFLHDVSPGYLVANNGGAAGVTITLSLITLSLITLRSVSEWIAGHRRQLLFPNWSLIAPQILFICVGLLSLINAQDVALVWFEVLRLLLLMLLFVMVTSLDEMTFSRIILLLPLAVCLETLVAIGQYGKGTTLGLAFIGEVDLFNENIDFDTRLRAVGLKGNPNMLSYFFEINFPICLALCLSKGSSLLQKMGGVGAVACVIGILPTLSRAGWMTLPVSTVLLLLTVYRDRLLTRTSVIAMLVFMVVFLIAAAIAGPIVFERFTADDGGSAAHRAPLNRAAWSMFEQFPWVGVGLNNFSNSFPLYDTTGYSRLFATENHVVHNMHMLILAEVGVFGYAAFLLLFIVAIFVAVRAARQLPLGHPVAAVAIGSILGLIAHLGHAFVDPGFKITLPAEEQVFITLGFIAACARYAPMWVRKASASHPLDPIGNSTLPPV